MSSVLLDRNDPVVVELFRSADNTVKILDKLDIKGRRTLNGQRYITDKDLSAILKVSRRTLQEYRSAGIIPYYLICGKVLYNEAEIQQFLEAGRRRSLAERELF